MANKSVTFTDGTDTIYCEPKPWQLLGTVGFQVTVNMPSSFNELLLVVKDSSSTTRPVAKIVPKEWFLCGGSEIFHSAFVEQGGSRWGITFNVTYVGNTIRLYEIDCLNGSTITQNPSTATLTVYYR